MKYMPYRQIEMNVQGLKCYAVYKMKLTDFWGLSAHVLKKLIDIIDPLNLNKYIFFALGI